MSKKPYHFNTVISAEGIIANGQYGTAGQYLVSNSMGGIYWMTPPAAILAGDGLASNATHYYVNANTGLVANADGTFVNSAYIQTITVNNANNATYLNSQNAAYYTNASNISTGTLAEPRLPYRINQNLNTANTPSFTGMTFTANVNMSNNTITWLKDPTSAQDAATKKYVDDVAQGLHAVPSVKAATTTNLTANYLNGTLGVGATLTSTTNVALPSIDGVSGWTQYDGILVKNQSNTAHNGRYYVSNTGSASYPWILTRCGYCDQASEIPGAYVFVDGGTLYGNTGWVASVANAQTFVVGTGAINWFQFAGVGTYTAGDYLSLNGTEFNVNATSTATAGVVVARDINGSFAANVITANVVGTANNTNNLGGQLPAYYTNATNLATGIVPDARLNSANATQKGIMFVVDSITNTSILVAASANSVKRVYDSSTNASNISTGTLAYARLPSGLVNTSSNFTMSGVITHAGNVVFNTTAGLQANGVFGTEGQFLTSNGTTIYWSDPPASGVTSIQEGTGIAVDQNTGDVTVSLVSLTALPASYTGGISDISIDIYGRVTSVSGSAGFLTNATLPLATTSVKGIVQLTSATNDNSNSLAATASAVKAAYDLAASKGTGTVTSLTPGPGISLSPNPITTTGTISLASGVITPASLNNGISAITVDTYGRVTSVTGGANYLTGVTAGNGLTSSTVGSVITLDVGAGPGISVGADSVGLASGVITPASLSNGISAITVDTYGRVTSVTGGANYFNTAGNGLTSSGGTVNVGAGPGISVAADTVGLASGVITAQSLSGGISAITVDTYGRVTSVTGSGNYVTSVSNTSGQTTVSGPTTSPSIGLAPVGPGYAVNYSGGISAINIDTYGRVTSVTGTAGYITNALPDLALRCLSVTGVSTSGSRTVGFSGASRNALGWTVNYNTTTGSYEYKGGTYYYTNYNSTTISLPAGTYYVDWYVTGYAPSAMGAFTYLDASGTIIMRGSGSNMPAGGTLFSEGKGVFTLASSASLSVKLQASTTGMTTLYGDGDYQTMGTGETASVNYAALVLRKL